MWFIFQSAVALLIYAGLLEVMDPNVNYGYGPGFYSFGGAFVATWLLSLVIDKAKSLRRPSRRLRLDGDEPSNRLSGVKRPRLKVGDPR